MRFAFGEQPWPTTGSKRDACCPRLSAKTDNMLVSLTRIAPNWPLALYSCALPATCCIAIKVMLLGCSGSATAPTARLDQSPDQVQCPISVRFANLASGHLPGRQSTGRSGSAMPLARQKCPVLSARMSRAQRALAAKNSGRCFVSKRSSGCLARIGRTPTYTRQRNGKHADHHAQIRLLVAAWLGVWRLRPIIELTAKMHS